MDLTEQEKYKRIIEKRISAARRILERAEKVVNAVDCNEYLTPLETVQIQEVALGTRNQRQAEITRLERALSLIESGVFGSCLKCGTEINAKRLEIYPDEIICPGCKN